MTAYPHARRRGCISAVDTGVARRAWQRFEPLHGVVYFAPEVRAATDALGLKGGWMSYFGCRAAPLGAVPPAVVTAIFHGFHPDMVARAIPDAWAYASPDQLIAARLAAVDQAYRRLLGDSVADLGEIAELAGAAAASVDTAGRPLGAANAALPVPDEPHLALWHATTVLREHRGDGHVTTLVSEGVGPCEALVLMVAVGRATAPLLRAARKWCEDEWAAAEDSLATRGLVDADGRATEAGWALRREIERRTDRLALRPYVVLGEERTEDLLRDLYALADRVIAAGGVPMPNPIGTTWPPTDPLG
jgi:hypothetical protein